MEKILITGGAGFIGCHLINYLFEKRDCEIHVVDNLSRGKLDSEFKNLVARNNIRFIEADLTKRDYQALLHSDYSYIYHFSAIVGVKNVTKNPDKTLYVNTLSILNLLEWLKTNQKKLKKMFFASTSEIYAGTGKHYNIPIPTDEKVNLCLEDIASARTTYALSKMLGESACFNYSDRHAIPFTIARYHNIYGPRMGYDHVIPELMLRTSKSKGILGVYSSRHTRAFCYVRDAVRATAGLAESTLSNGKIFNVGNNTEEVTIVELAKKIVNIVNPGITVESLRDEAGSPIRRCPNIDRLKHLINFRPEISLTEGIKLTWQWYNKKGILVKV